MHTPPPVFLTKSAQAIENKGRQREELAQESLRVRKLLRRLRLTVSRSESVASEGGLEKAIEPGVAARKGVR